MLFVPCLLAANTKDEMHSAEGEAAAQRGAWSEAERLFRAFERDHPASSEAVLDHVRSLLKLDQPFEAILELGPFVDSHPAAVSAVSLYTDLLQSVAHNVPRAEEVLLRATRSAPAEFTFWMSLGKLYLAKPEPAKAADAFATAAKLAPGNAAARAGLAYAHSQSGHDAAAGLEFQTALASGGGENGAVLALYAAYLQENGKALESITYYTRALHAGLEDWQIYVHRAKAYLQTGEPGRAEADALHALQLGGERRESRLLLLKIYQQRGETAEAEEQSRIIAKTDEKENELWAKNRAFRQTLENAEAAIVKNDCAAAVPAYERLVKEVPTFYESWFPLGVCYSRLGRTAEAEQALETYLKAQPLSADAHSALGLLFLSTARFDQAEHELRSALEIDPSASEAKSALAAICQQTGKCRSGP